MKKIVSLFLLIGLLSLPCFAVSWDIDTARGVLTINENDVLGHSSKFTGTIENINDVTFYEWNFTRKQKEEIFINCQNITLINCNLENVIILPDSGVELINCSHLYRREYTENEITYEEIITHKNEKIIFRKNSEDIDIIERDFGSLPEVEKQKIKDKYIEHNLPIIQKTRNKIFISKGEVDVQEKINIFDSRRDIADLQSIIK